MRSIKADSHNFGRRVTERGSSWIVKPRPVLWEQLMLSRASPLRTFLRTAAKGEFDFLPTVKVSGDKVERIVLGPLRSASRETRSALATILGRSLALWSWLGVADLHWENLVLGVDARERIVFGPLDIEMIFADLSLPTQTKLIPDADPEYAEVCRHSAGVRRVLSYLGKPISGGDLLSIVSAYHGALALLDHHARAIADIIGALPALRTTPIRVLLRSTGDYVRARAEPISPPLLDAEAEQLARGDIPYFFRLYGERGVRYYLDAKLERAGRLDVPLDPLLAFGRSLRSGSRRALREQGLFAVVGAFDHPSLNGRHENATLALDLRKQSIVVKLASGAELECTRNLRAIVGSVYLPCRCGEARTVFA